MPIEAYIVQALEGVPEFGKRIYPLTGPAGTLTPYCIYTLANFSELEVLHGWEELTESEYDIDIVDDTYSGIKSLAKKAVPFIRNLEGTNGIQRVSIRGNSPEIFENEVGLYRKILTISITYRR